MKRTVFLLYLLLCTMPLCAATLTGVVRDAGTSDVLPYVNIHIQGLKIGATTDADGRYTLSDLAPGAYILRISHIGYAPAEVRAAVATHTEKNIALKAILLPGQTVTVTAARAIERETPVTFSNITRKELDDRYTIQDMPKLLSELPSINTYDETGNGIGYSYITMRGFDQRRIAVMINGIPQNDPEDHNVYWVNFPDLASSLEDIQVQRGAGSAFYGPAAIGGSINLVTNRFNPEPAFTFMVLADMPENIAS